MIQESKMALGDFSHEGDLLGQSDAGSPSGTVHLPARRHLGMSQLLAAHNPSLNLQSQLSIWVHFGPQNPGNEELSPAGLSERV